MNTKRILALLIALGALAAFVYFFAPHCSSYAPFMAKGTAADCKHL